MHRARAGGLLLVVAMAATACTGDDNATEPDEGSSVEPMSMEEFCTDFVEETVQPFNDTIATGLDTAGAAVDAGDQEQFQEHMDRIVADVRDLVQAYNDASEAVPNDELGADLQGLASASDELADLLDTLTLEQIQEGPEALAAHEDLIVEGRERADDVYACCQD